VLLARVAELRAHQVAARRLPGQHAPRLLTRVAALRHGTSPRSAGGEQPKGDADARDRRVAVRHHETVLTTADRLGRDRVSLPQPMPQPLAFNDIVIVRDTPATRRDGVASLRGIVAGISRSEEPARSGPTPSGCRPRGSLDVRHLPTRPTGETDPNGTQMSGESIRVNQHCEPVDETER